MSLNKIEDFDDELSFLATHVENAVRKGMGYDRSKANTLLKKMKEREKELAANQFRTQHHKVDVSELKSKKEEFGKGFKDAKKNWMNKTPLDKDIKNPGVQKVVEVKKFDVPKKKKVDLATQKKHKSMANKLFGGPKGKPKLSKPKKTGMFAKPSGATAEKKKSNPFAKPKNAKVEKPSESNLLDDSNPQTDESLNDSVDLLSGKVPAKKQGGGIFSKPKNAGPSKPSFNLSPNQMAQADFESYWGTLEEELFDDDVPTKRVRNQKAFQGMVDEVGFHIVHTINNDNICAATLNGSDVVLLYGQYKIVGGLEIRVKAGDKDKCQKVIDIVRKYCSTH